MLKWNPNDRIDAKNALLLPYFDEFRIKKSFNWKFKIFLKIIYFYLNQIDFFIKLTLI